MTNYPDSATYELAGFGNRLVAFIIDYFILAAISFGVLMLVGPLFSTVLELMLLDIAINAVYYWYFWTRHNGQSPGKKAMNIRIIKADGKPLSDADALLRIFGYYVGRLTLFFGYIWAAFDANNQAWHDKMANTYVVVTEAQNKTITL